MKIIITFIFALIFILQAEPLKKEILLVQAAKKKKALPSVNELRSIRNNKGKRNLIRLTIQVGDEFHTSSIEKYGFSIISKRKSLVFIEGPRSLTYALSEIPGISCIQKPAPVYTLMDKAREASFVNPVHDSLSQLWNKEIKGNGVIVGVLDSEFDIRHPAFLDENGNTRFIAVWDFYPEDKEGFPSYAYSKERVPYGAALLGDELKDFPHIGLGKSTHGTHVASIAAGSVTGNGFHGFAPKAHLIGVKVYQDHDEIIDKYGNPFYTQYAAHSGELSHAIEWIFSIADSLNLPCVINMSIGSSMGPHDGTSLFDRFIDSISGPGRVIVGSAGNSGDKKLHLGLDLSPNDTIGSWGDPLFFDKDAEGNDGSYILMDFWGEKGSEFSVQAIVENKNSLENIRSSFVSNMSTGEWEPDTAIINNDTVIFYFETDSIVEVNKKSRMMVGIVSFNKNVNLGFRITGNGRVNGWHSNMYRNFDSKNTDSFIDGDTLNTVIEIGGTSRSAISVAAYVTKGVFENWKGDTLDWLFEEYNEKELGIAYWSSVGPTIDGRQKPDVAAPGKMIAAAHSRIIDQEGNTDLIADWPNYPDTSALYAFLRGTSMSAPMMTGATALMLQLNPELDHEKIREILSKSSYTDEYTGVVPNYRWGVGKLNVLKAIETIAEESPIIEKNEINIKYIAHDFLMRENRLVYSGRGIERLSTITIYDLRGRAIFKKQIDKFTKDISIDLKNRASNSFIVLIKSNTTNLFKKQFVFIN